MELGYYRIRSAAERLDRTSKWGALIELFEVDENGFPVRQLNIYEGAPFRERFDRGRPFNENAMGERFGQMRSEPLDLATVESYRVGPEEFEFAWTTGQLRQRDFAEFKWEVLAETSEDRQGVPELVWEANNWFPNLSASERLGIAERALRVLLAERLVSLMAGPLSGEEPAPVPRDEQDALLRSWQTWSAPDGVKAFVGITDAGVAALEQTASSRRLP